MAELAFLIDFIGHIGYVILIFGTYLITSQKRIGWLLRMVGEAVWIAIGITLGLTSIWVWGTVFMVMDFTGYVKWSPSANGKAT